MIGTDTVYIIIEQLVGGEMAIVAAYSNEDEAYAALERYVAKEQHSDDRADLYGILPLPLYYDRQQLDVENPFEHHEERIVYDFFEMNVRSIRELAEEMGIDLE